VDEAPVPNNGTGWIRFVGCITRCGGNVVVLVRFSVLLSQQYPEDFRRQAVRAEHEIPAGTRERRHAANRYQNPEHEAGEQQSREVEMMAGYGLSHPAIIANGGIRAQRDFCCLGA
jgi:hypothetical protein